MSVTSAYNKDNELFTRFLDRLVNQVQNQSPGENASIGFSEMLDSRGFRDARGSSARDHVVG